MEEINLDKNKFFFNHITYSILTYINDLISNYYLNFEFNSVNTINECESMLGYALKFN